MPPKAPPNLGSMGRRVWKSVVTDASEQGLTLDSREALWLETAARIADRITLLEDQLAASAVVTEGHAGQPVVNGLVAEIRQQQALLATTLGRLKVDPPEQSSGSGGNKYRAAALTRWQGAN